MTRTARKARRAYGVRILLSCHPEIRRLKRVHAPSVHGNKVWRSSWLLMDYFYRRGLRHGARIVEVGCGWGLAGIYCAKKHGAEVTALDIDADVFPYVLLHADINGVEVTTMKKDFTALTGTVLKKYDVLLGADICFWDTLVEPLKKLVLRALSAGVELVLIADPGRSTFDNVCSYFVDRRQGEVLEWTASRPQSTHGRILRITTDEG